MIRTQYVTMLRVRRANPPDEVLRRYTKKKREFLFSCADWTVALLSQTFLHEYIEGMLAKEGITLDSVRDVRVMVLPPIYRVRGVLHGTLHVESKQVSIYPVLPQHLRFKSSPDHSIPTWAEAIADEGVKQKLARSVTETFFHELLHLKHPRQERLVRKLASEYIQNYEEFLRSSGLSITGPRMTSG